MKPKFTNHIVVGAAIALIGIIGIPFYWYYLLPDIGCETCIDVFDVSAAILAFGLTIGGLALLIRGVCGEDF